jgi:hypothetical protein
MIVPGTRAGEAAGLTQDWIDQKFGYQRCHLVDMEDGAEVLIYYVMLWSLCKGSATVRTSGNPNPLSGRR